jgi:hypothetical protein
MSADYNTIAEKRFSTSSCSLRRHKRGFLISNALSRGALKAKIAATWT